MNPSRAQWSISRATMLANSAGGLPGSQRRGAVSSSYYLASFCSSHLRPSGLAIQRSAALRAIVEKISYPGLRLPK